MQLVTYVICLRYIVLEKGHMRKAFVFSGPKWQDWNKLVNEVMNTVALLTLESCSQQVEQSVSGILIAAPFLLQTMCLFDYKNGTLLQKWTGHDKEVTKVGY